MLVLLFSLLVSTLCLHSLSLLSTVMCLDWITALLSVYVCSPSPLLLLLHSLATALYQRHSSLSSLCSLARSLPLSLHSIGRSLTHTPGTRTRSQAQVHPGRAGRPSPRCMGNCKLLRRSPSDQCPSCIRQADCSPSLFSHRGCMDRL